MRTRTLISIIALTCVLMLMGCETTAASPASIQTSPLETPEKVTIMPASLPENSVIFTTDHVEDWWWFSLGFREAGEAWTPQPTDVAAVEAGLDAFLRNADDAYFRDSPPIWERLPNYKRQYFGIIDGERRLIYANFFCDDFGIDWQNELVAVDDGGDCYFGVKFDPETETFFDLFVNGEA